MTTPDKITQPAIKNNTRYEISAFEGFKFKKTYAINAIRTFSKFIEIIKWNIRLKTFIIDYLTLNFLLLDFLSKLYYLEYICCYGCSG